MRTILLTMGYVTQVDDEDFFDLINLTPRWHANEKDNGVYAGGSVKGEYIYMHKAIGDKMKLVGIADHIDRDTLNNQRYNLRGVNDSQNGMNKGISSNNTSGYKGIVWDRSRGKWQARIVKDNVHINLGRFDDINDAVEARRQAVIKYFGQYACEDELEDSLEFPEEEIIRPKPIKIYTEDIELTEEEEKIVIPSNNNGGTGLAGIRIDRAGKYSVRVRSKGEEIHIGTYSDLNIAIKHCKRARFKYSRKE